MILSLVLSRSSYCRIISAAPVAVKTSHVVLRLADARQQPDWHRLMHSDSYLNMIRLIIAG
jgi:hypothetical protein